MSSDNPKKKIKIDSKLVPFSLRERLHELTGNELKLWLCMFLHSDRNGEAYPSNKLLMKETGMSAPTFKAAKRGLRTKGWFTNAKKRVRDDGSYSTVKEQVHIPTLSRATNDTYLGQESCPTPVSHLTLPSGNTLTLHEVPTSEVPNIEEPNMEDELVSKLVSSDVSLRSTSTTSPNGEGGEEHSPLTSKDKNNTNQETSKNNPNDALWEERAPVETRLESFGFEHIWKLPCWDILHAEFGLTASLDENVHQRVLDIHEAMNYERMDADELALLIRWALQNKFWKTRILSVASLSKAMFRGLLTDDTGGVHEKGIVPQFRRTAKNKAIRQRQRDVELYKGIQAKRQYRRDSGNDPRLDLKDDISMDEPVAVGKGFDPDDCD